jgi:hypothetical protein
MLAVHRSLRFTLAFLGGSLTRQSLEDDLCGTIQANVLCIRNMERDYITLSFSAPPELVQPIKERCLQLGMSRSEYIRRLFAHDFFGLGAMNEEKWFETMAIKKKRSKKGTIRTNARQRGNAEGAVSDALCP